MMKEPATINGIAIRFDGKLVNMTNLWKAAGGDKSKQPKFWLRRGTTLEFLASLAGKVKVTQDHLLTMKRGKGGGTFAHWQIALAYAKYLSPEFHIAANKIIKRYIEEEIDPSKAIDRAVSRYEATPS